DMPDAGNAYGGAVDPGARFLYAHRDSHHRIAGSRMVKLLVSDARAFRAGDPDLGDNLVGTKFRGEHAGEELGCREATFTAAAYGHDLGIEGQNGRRIVGGGVGSGQRSPDGTTVAHLDVSNLRGSLRQQRTGNMKDLGRGDVGVRRHRADNNAVTRFANVIQPGDTSKVNHDRWSGQA